MIKIKKDKKKTHHKSVKKSRKILSAQHKDYLQLLASAKNKRKRRNQLIDLATKQEIDSVSECVSNILTGNVPITKRQLTNLRRHRHALRDIASKRKSLNKKKSILKQKGGLIGAVLPFALKALSSIVPSLFT